LHRLQRYLEMVLGWGEGGRTSRWTLSTRLLRRTAFNEAGLLANHYPIARWVCSISGESVAAIGFQVQHRFVCQYCCSGGVVLARLAAGTSRALRLCVGVYPLFRRLGVSQLELDGFWPTSVQLLLLLSSAYQSWHHTYLVEYMSGGKCTRHASYEVYNMIERDLPKFASDLHTQGVWRCGLNGQAHMGELVVRQIDLRTT
jgi:hypothetical protein